MNWPSIAIIALIVIGLIVFYALTGIGSKSTVMTSIK